MTAGAGLHPADWELAGGDPGAQHRMGPGRPRRRRATPVERRRRAVVDLPWTVLRPGARRPGRGRRRARWRPRVRPPTRPWRPSRRAALAVLTADCAPVALASPEGVLGVAHAGWRGLRAGVVEATVTSDAPPGRDPGRGRARPVHPPVLLPVRRRRTWTSCEPAWGPGPGRRTGTGRPPWTSPPACGRPCIRPGQPSSATPTTCTSCSDDHWSWRRSHTARRQATVVWRP